MVFRAPSICPRCRQPKPAGQRCGCTPVARTPDPRNAERARPYATPEWKALRAQHLKAHPTCCRCGEHASVVDHARPWRSDRRLFLDPANLQSLCRSCHSAKTSAEDGGFGNPLADDRPGGCDATGRPLDPHHPWNLPG
ncbi:HNH endonuclease signature motif containing protein [Nitrospirillum amazonense]|uniref:HNH endonuclease n=1 Tax=Nitrospirillum amazonense TaxID=28077 RepID=UPI002DD44D87|nr:HNH endonuclease signature motif containing protein [Nitrospirillum amazonense]MEC4590562.1 HNH endonuclease signature motif containing protein [Nitrospirillum amazonense]